MATKANTSSVKTEKGYKLAAFGNQKKAALKAENETSNTDNSNPVLNARKGKDMSLTKAKAKTKAKMAKASKKKNKK